jgi:hypothetical protein
MKVKGGYAVLEHSDGQILRIEVFTGDGSSPNPSKKEAVERFRELVIEREMEDGQNFHDAKAVAETESSGESQSYTSDGGDGDHDIIVIALD